LWELLPDKPGIHGRAKLTAENQLQNALRIATGCLASCRFSQTSALRLAIHEPVMLEIQNAKRGTTLAEKRHHAFSETGLLKWLSRTCFYNMESADKGRIETATLLNFLENMNVKFL
jgi:hypothetical protein